MLIPKENSQNMRKHILGGFKNIVIWNIVRKLAGCLQGKHLK
jgi:hypothetical protein